MVQLMGVDHRRIFAVAMGLAFVVIAVAALYRRPRTTKPEPGHKIYPYLLRGIEITRPNQVWAMDITYGAPRP